MRIYAKSENNHYRLNVSPQWAQRHDNGALISCGLTIPDDLSIRSLNRLLSTGKAVVVSADEYNHSGCQSRCKLRGDDMCQW